MCNDFAICSGDSFEQMAKPLVLVPLTAVGTVVRETTGEAQRLLAANRIRDLAFVESTSTAQPLVTGFYSIKVGCDLQSYCIALLHVS